MTEALWRCPVCGQSFVARNMPHSCLVVPLDEHFAASEPRVRAVFDALVAAVQRLGPVTINATKSRISFQARMRFAGTDRPRRRHLVANFVLTRAVASERLTRVDFVAPYYYVHRLRLENPGDVDEELEGWLAEAYEVGVQRHLRDPGWRKLRRPPPWVRVPGAGSRPP